jgi:hypothetical protein
MGWPFPFAKRAIRMRCVTDESRKVSSDTPKISTTYGNILQKAEYLSRVSHKNKREIVCVWAGVVPGGRGGAGGIVSIWLGGGGSTPALATKVCRNEVLQ